MVKVVNLNNENYDVYIGRSKSDLKINKWGNPFIIGKDGNRKEVIEKYEKYFITQLKLGNITISELQGLYGKKLGCFCKPLDCHGDVIKKYVLKSMENYEATWL